MNPVTVGSGGPGANRPTGNGGDSTFLTYTAGGGGGGSGGGPPGGWWFWWNGIAYIITPLVVVAMIVVDDAIKNIDELRSFKFKLQIWFWKSW